MLRGIHFQAARTRSVGYCSRMPTNILPSTLAIKFQDTMKVPKKGGSSRASNMVLSVEYYKTMCHFLKYKSVSPHAYIGIYKSLFME